MFSQKDVAWYIYKTSKNIWDVKAAGTLYLTNHKLILYDNGFRNIWTKLSVEGDFPEQICFFRLEDIVNVNKVNSSNTGLGGIIVSTKADQCFLAPSYRKYSGRITPILNEYASLTELGDKLIIIKDIINIERTKKENKAIK